MQWKLSRSEWAKRGAGNTEYVQHACVRLSVQCRRVVGGEVPHLQGPQVVVPVSVRLVASRAVSSGAKGRRHPSRGTSLPDSTEKRFAVDGRRETIYGYLSVLERKRNTF